ncbi:ECF RNA polymerase sigma factor SigL [bioreactor metagenome]|jgi:RNA polymerase sigma-70 factor (ECF subfamily)|uniref:ECF RNA polymerase sigma factor SigL n=1 Tax=bioreactor metagenome TaxID=1076179 RepID=A0A644V118_9ZZZZ|nr:RNA polymerase sigma-70 factor [Paludibacter sp.]
MEIDIIKSYIRELKNDSHKAFNAIYDMYADKLYAFALAHTKSRQMSEDIVQDTFLKLWKIRKTINTEGSLQSLLFKISKNKIIDMFRSQINKVEFELYLSYMEENSNAEAEAERRLYYDDFYKALQLSKEQLSERQLEIFEMSREEGKSIEEIASELNLSEQTVKNQISSSLKKIRSQILKYSIFLLPFFNLYSAT